MRRPSAVLRINFHQPSARARGEVLSAWASSFWFLLQVRVLVARSALVLVKCAGGWVGTRAVQHISCIRVRARAALMLMRCVFGARMGMHLLTRWSFGVDVERRVCV